MSHIRYEEYSEDGAEPFVLHVGLERTGQKCSREKNWHEAVEIQLCTGGQGSVLINGIDYPFCKGDIAVINSNLIHHTGTQTSITYTCLIVSDSFCRRLGIIPAELSFKPIVRSERLQELIEQLCETYLHDGTTLRAAKCSLQILKILLQLAEHHCARGEVKIGSEKPFEKVKQSIKYIREHFDQRITLDALASHVHCDKYTLCHDFKRATSRTVVQYINDCRTQKAIEFLSAGHSVAQTSELCGFEDPSYFTRTFKRCVGVLPSKYQSRARSNVARASTERTGDAET